MDTVSKIEYPIKYIQRGEALYKDVLIRIIQVTLTMGVGGLVFVNGGKILSQTF
jgi:hypothetical protein